LNRKEGVVMVAVLLSTFIGGVYAAQNVPAIQQVFVTNFPKNQNVTVTNLPQSKFLSVFINKTMGIGEIASYPVAGWKTVSIMTNVTTITNIGITIQLPIPFWGFTLSGVRGCLLAGSGNCNALPSFVTTVPVQGDQIWFEPDPPTTGYPSVSVQIGLYLQM